MKKRIWIPAFMGLAALSIGVAQFGDQTLALILKGLPLLLLIVVVGRGIQAQAQGRSRLMICVMAGLVASLAADIAITFSFLAGIALFFIAHCLYITGMGWNSSRPLGRVVSYIPAIALFVGMYSLLIASGHVPEKMVIPVVAYMAVISLMWGRALSRGFVSPANRYGKLMAIGATLFVLSDSLLAINKWVVPLEYERVAILGTYYLAQMLIAWGALNHAPEAPPEVDEVPPLAKTQEEPHKIVLL